MRFPRHLAAVLAFTATLCAQQPPQTNSSILDANGTAHVTRVIPVPNTISPEAQATLRRPAGAENQTLAERRTSTDAWQTHAGEVSLKAYPVKIESLTIAGVPVRNVLPLDETSQHPDRVLINVHGGGFNSDSGSFTESIPSPTSPTPASSPSSTA